MQNIGLIVGESNPLTRTNISVMLMNLTWEVRRSRATVFLFQHNNTVHEATPHCIAITFSVRGYRLTRCCKLMLC